MNKTIVLLKDVLEFLEDSYVKMARDYPHNLILDNFDLQERIEIFIKENFSKEEYVKMDLDRIFKQVRLECSN